MATSVGRLDAAQSQRDTALANIVDPTAQKIGALLSGVSKQFANLGKSQAEILQSRLQSLGASPEQLQTAMAQSKAVADFVAKAKADEKQRVEKIMERVARGIEKQGDPQIASLN